ncbi:hypothetical protein HDU96_002328, partial [Phlyctochytrium bullatum]
MIRRWLLSGIIGLIVFVAATSLLFVDVPPLLSWQPPPLLFGDKTTFPLKSGRLKIVLLSDMHLGEEPSSSWGFRQDINTTRVIRLSLFRETPDLAVLLGDQVTGENISKNATAYLDRIFDLLSYFKVPWMTVYGNHDDRVHFNRSLLIEDEAQWPMSLTRKGPAELRGANYDVLLVDSKGTPQFVLYVLDTHGNTVGRNEETWVLSDQVAWLRGRAEVLASQHGAIPSLMFFHIPPRTARDLNDSESFHRYCSGFKNETGIGVQHEDEGLENAIRELATPVVATFSG